MKDPMYHFFQIKKDWVNKAGLRLQDVLELKKENIDLYHRFRGKLLASELRCDPHWIKLRGKSTIYTVENDELAILEAQKHYIEELTKNEPSKMAMATEAES